jgi:hypothetical protein
MRGRHLSRRVAFVESQQISLQHTLFHWTEKGRRGLQKWSGRHRDAKWTLQLLLSKAVSNELYVLPRTSYLITLIIDEWMKRQLIADVDVDAIEKELKCVHFINKLLLIYTSVHALTV